MKNKKAYFITQAAVIAALYVVLTLFINAFDLASGAIQVRISEALTILPYFTPAAVPGLFIGCLLSNFMTGAAIWDIIFGSLATLIGAIGTYLLRKWKWCAPLSPILSNTIASSFMKAIFMSRWLFSTTLTASAVFIEDTGNVPTLITIS